MSKMNNMRAIEIPKFRAVCSGPQPLGRLFGSADSFDGWVNAHQNLIKKHIFEPQDFLWHENNDINQSVWALAIEDGVTEVDVAPYGIIEFPGGMYLVATADESNAEDIEQTVVGMRRWIAESGVFEYGGFPMSGMCNMPNPDGRLDKALGIAQQQIFLPLKLKNQQ